MQRFVLIGCSKSKAKDCGRTMVPEDLYTGQLFEKRVQYAKRLGVPWAVLSAKCGLLYPYAMRMPYELTMKDLSRLEAAAWPIVVAHEFINSFDDDNTDPRKVTVEIHAGRSYCEPLATILGAVGFKVETPCAGMGIGEQLQAYTSGQLSQFGCKV